MDVLIPGVGVVSIETTALVPGAGVVQAEVGGSGVTAPTSTLYGPLMGPFGGPI